MRGQEFDGRDHIVAGHGIYTFGRAVYRDEWLYIRLLHPGVYSYPGLYDDPDLPGDGLELLHDLESDPNQTENLVASHREKTAEMRGLLDRWLAEHVSDGWPDQPAVARGRDPLAQTATAGPYLYVDPDELIGLYRDLDRPAEQVTALTRTMTMFPRE